MRMLGAAVLLVIGDYSLVGALVGAGVDAGPAVRMVTIPLVGAAAAGALIWSWAGGHMTPRIRRGR